MVIKKEGDRRIVHASGGQGDSFRENRPPGPVKHLQKLLL